MKKILASALVISFFVTSTAVAFAQPQRRLPRTNRTFDRSQIRILSVLKANQQELGIADEQIERIQNLVFSHKEKTIEMRGEQNLAQLELQKLMQNRDNLDYGKIEAILSKTSALKNGMIIERLKLRKEINNVLTPEQQEALKAKARSGIDSRIHDLRNRMQQRLPRLRDRIRR